jgi:hypothetical protein
MHVFQTLSKSLSRHIYAATSLDITRIPQLSLGFIPRVPYILYMTSSIPDGLSSADLEAMLENAPSEDTQSKEMTPAEMRKLVHDTVEELTDKFGTLFGYKLTAMYCIGVMKSVHDDAAIDRYKRDDVDGMLSWARDGGKCQSAYTDVESIFCGPQDFTIED